MLYQIIYTGTRMLSHFSRVQLFLTPWTIPRQAPLSMGFSRQEYWSGLPCPPPGIFPTQGSTHVSYISCTGRQILYHECHLGSPIYTGINYMYVFIYTETNILPSIFTLTVSNSLAYLYPLHFLSTVIITHHIDFSLKNKALKKCLLPSKR